MEAYHLESTLLFYHPLCKKQRLGTVLKNSNRWWSPISFSTSKAREHKPNAAKNGDRTASAGSTSLVSQICRRSLRLPFFPVYQLIFSYGYPSRCKLTTPTFFKDNSRWRGLWSSSSLLSKATMRCCKSFKVKYLLLPSMDICFTGKGKVVSSREEICILAQIQGSQNQLFITWSQWDLPSFKQVLN